MRELVVLGVAALVLALGLAASPAIPTSAEIESRSSVGGAGDRAAGNAVPPSTEGRSVYVVPSPWGGYSAITPLPGVSDYLAPPRRR